MPPVGVRSFASTQGLIDSTILFQQEHKMGSRLGTHRLDPPAQFRREEAGRDVLVQPRKSHVADHTTKAWGTSCYCSPQEAVGLECAVLPLYETELLLHYLCPNVQ